VDFAPKLDRPSAISLVRYSHVKGREKGPLSALGSKWQ